MDRIAGRATALSLAHVAQLFTSAGDALFEA